MVENKSSLFGIIAIIIGATGLGFGAFSIVNFQTVEGPQGPPGDDGQDGIDGVNGTDPYVHYCSSEVEVRDALDSIGTGYGIITIINDITISETFVINGSGNYIIQGINSIISCGGDITAFEIMNATSLIIRNLRINASAITVNSRSIIYINEINDNPVYIENVNVFGDSDKNGYGVVIQSENTWINNCIFSQISRGILTQSDRAHIRDNTINNCEWGIDVSGRHNIVEGNLIEDNTEIGILLNNDYNTINSNIIKNVSVSPTLSIGIGIFISTGEGNTISNNELVGIRGLGILIKYLCSFNSITGNFIDGLSIADPGVRYGIFLFTSTGMYDDYNAIIGNVIMNCNNPGTGGGYGIRTVGLDVRYTTIVGNTLYNNDVNLEDNGLLTVLSGNNFL